MVLLDAPVLTSERRWRELGFLRTILTHLALRSLFALGVPPNQLARLYRRVR